MEDKPVYRSSGKYFIGLMLIALGTIFLLDNFNFIYVGHIGRLWPAIFILFGTVKLLETDHDTRHGNGIFWIFLGAWLLVSMNGWFDLTFHDSWPILIIGWGVSMLWRGMYRQPYYTISEEEHHGN
jgi:hypothetical protein